MNLMDFRDNCFREAKNILYIFMIDVNMFSKNMKILAKVFEKSKVTVVKRPFDQMEVNYPNIYSVDIQLNFPLIPFEGQTFANLLSKEQWDVIFIQGTADTIWADSYYQHILYPLLYDLAEKTPISYLTPQLNVIPLNDGFKEWGQPIHLNNINFTIDCPGQMSGRKLGHLVNLVRKRPKTEYIVEIGRYFGRSTIALAQALKLSNSGKLVSIDFNEQKDFQNNLSKHGLSEYVEVWNCFSREGYDKWMVERADKQIGLVFIDGDHSYEGAYMDIQQWSQLLPPDGIIAVDDYNSDLHSGVMLAANELIIWSGNYYDIQFKEDLLTACKKG